MWEVARGWEKADNARNKRSGTATHSVDASSCRSLSSPQGPQTRGRGKITSVVGRHRMGDMRRLNSLGARGPAAYLVRNLSRLSSGAARRSRFSSSYFSDAYAAFAFRAAAQVEHLSTTPLILDGSVHKRFRNPVRRFKRSFKGWRILYGWLCFRGK